MSWRDKLPGLLNILETANDYNADIEWASLRISPIRTKRQDWIPSEEDVGLWLHVQKEIVIKFKNDRSGKAFLARLAVQEFEFYSKNAKQYLPWLLELHSGSEDPKLSKTLALAVEKIRDD